MPMGRARPQVGKGHRRGSRQRLKRTESDIAFLHHRRDVETPQDELAFLNLLDGTRPPAAEWVHQGAVELRAPGSDRPWQPAEMILTKEYLVLCAPAPSASASPSHREGDLVLVEDAIPVSQIWYCKAAADRKSRRFMLAADGLLRALGLATSEHTTSKDVFLLKTMAAGFHKGRKFVFRCANERECQQWSLAVRQQVQENTMKGSRAQRFEGYREYVRRSVDSAPFQIIIALLIALNFGVSVFDTEYHPTRESAAGRLIESLDLVFTSLFAVECAMNMFGNWFRPWASDSWNLFDFLVVVVSITADASQNLPNVTVLRTARVFRVIRLFKRLKALRTIVNAITASFWPVGNSLFILALVSFVYAILGVRLYETRAPADFGTFTVALLSMIQICTGEGWGIGRPLYENDGNFDAWAVIFFISYLIIVSVILVNIVLAVLVDEFIKSVCEEQGNEKRDDENRRLVSMHGMKKHVVVLEPLLCVLAVSDTAEELRCKIEDLFFYFDEDESGFVNFHAMLFGLYSITSVPDSHWDEVGKIFLSRSSHKRFVGDLGIPRAGMDFEAFELAIQTQLQFFLQRTLTEGAFSTQDQGHRGLMFTMKQLQIKLHALNYQNLLQNESTLPVLSHSSLSCTPTSLPPGDEGRGAKIQLLDGSLQALPAAHVRMVHNRLLSKSPVEGQQRVAQLEKSVSVSGLDAYEPHTPEDSLSLNTAAKHIAVDEISKIIDEKLAALEERIIKNVGTLLQAVSDNMLQEQQISRATAAAALTERHEELMKRMGKMEHDLGTNSAAVDTLQKIVGDMAKDRGKERAGTGDMEIEIEREVNRRLESERKAQRERRERERRERERERETERERDRERGRKEVGERAWSGARDRQRDNSPMRWSSNSIDWSNRLGTTSKSSHDDSPPLEWAKGSANQRVSAEVSRGYTHSSDGLRRPGEAVGEPVHAHTRNRHNVPALALPQSLLGGDSPLAPRNRMGPESSGILTGVHSSSTSDDSEVDQTRPVPETETPTSLSDEEAYMESISQANHPDGPNPVIYPPGSPRVLMVSPRVAERGGRQRSSSVGHSDNYTGNHFAENPVLGFDDASQPARRPQERAVVARVDVRASGSGWQEGPKPRTISSAPLTPGRFNVPAEHDAQVLSPRFRVFDT